MTAQHYFPCIILNSKLLLITTEHPLICHWRAHLNHFINTCMDEYLFLQCHYHINACPQLYSSISVVGFVTKWSHAEITWIKIKDQDLLGRSLMLIFDPLTSISSKIKDQDHDRIIRSFSKIKRSKIQDHQYWSRLH